MKPKHLGFVSGVALVVAVFNLAVNNAYSADAVLCAANDARLGCDTRRVNTYGWEDSPFVSSDGNSLYFVYNPYSFWEVFSGGQPVYSGPERPGHFPSTNPWDDSTVYVASRRGDGWSTPRALFAGCCAMTYDNNAFYYQAASPLNAADQDIYILNRSLQQAAWLGSNLNSPYHEQNPHASVDGKRIIFTSVRPDGFGGTDLWSSTKNADGSWAPAVNLGPAINTAGDEDQAWINAQGTWMVFNRDLVFYQSTYNAQLGEWGFAVPINFGTAPGVMVAEVSFAVYKGKNEAYFVAVDATRQDTILMKSVQKTDGTWGTAQPVDIY